jgi:hypothetical protein
MSDNMISEIYKYNHRTGKRVMVPVDAVKAPRIRIPEDAKVLGKQFVDRPEGRARLAEAIYREGLAIDVGVYLTYRGSRAERQEFETLMHYQNTVDKMNREVVMLDMNKLIFEEESKK